MAALGSMATGRKGLAVVAVIIVVIAVITATGLFFLLQGRRELGLGMNEGVGSSSLERLRGDRRSIRGDDGRTDGCASVWHVGMLLLGILLRGAGG